MENYKPTTDDGKTAGIISYFTLIGWLIAYFAMYANNKTPLAAYQLRQTLLFHLASIVVSWAAALIIGMAFVTSGVFIGMSIIWIVRLGFLIIWIIGLIGAVNGERKPMPLIGEPAQNMFSGI
ncbi:hypothetical protein SNE26_05610 [Mucilaginibacter sp. cycad4]|uniref:hypothetical protein n=1 Tax=Mucilaginibacter sp. cycad4 TaxID=3342096 RepID=UPI002AAAEFBF|nr:hypothetical protein [Mucilaginibacter gossypii]WPV01242.1 hypothetical protein SNE26_05610 [Mucilaginibacter gossypii]